MEESTEYPLTPFLDFATKLDLVEDSEAGDEPIPWGYKACGEEIGRYPAEAEYQGAGATPWQDLPGYGVKPDDPA